MTNKFMAIFLAMLIICLPLAIAELETPDIVEDVEIDVPSAEHLEFDEPEDFEEWETGESIIVEVKKYEPQVLPASLIEDDDVPVYAFLSGKTLGSLLGSEATVEPFYSQPEIKYMRVRPLDEDTKDYVKGMPRFLRPKKYSLDNLGTLLIMLKQIETEEEVPDKIELNMNAIIEFENAERLFSMFQQDILIPEDPDEDLWRTKVLSDYSFFSGRGFIRASEIEDNSVKLTLYASEAHLGLNQLIPSFAGKAVSYIENLLGVNAFSPSNAPRPIRTIYLKKGETSDYYRLSSATGLAQDAFRVKLVDITDPMDKRARLRLSMDGKVQEVVVTEGSPLYPGSQWRVDSINVIYKKTEEKITTEVILKSGSEVVKVEKTEAKEEESVDPCESAEVLLKGLELPERLAEEDEVETDVESSDGRSYQWLLDKEEDVTTDVNVEDIFNLQEFSFKWSNDGDEVLEAGNYLWLLEEEDNTFRANYYNPKAPTTIDDLIVEFKGATFEEYFFPKDTKETIIEGDRKYEITYKGTETRLKGSQQFVTFHIASYNRVAVEEEPVEEETPESELVEDEDVAISPNLILDLDDFSIESSEDAPTLEEGHYLWLMGADENSLEFKLYVTAYDRNSLIPIASSEEETMDDYELNKASNTIVVKGTSSGIESDSIELIFKELKYIIEYQGLSDGNIKLNVKHYDLTPTKTSTEAAAATQTPESTERVRNVGTYSCQQKEINLYKRATVTVYDEETQKSIKKYTDTCVGDKLSEYYCEEKSVMKDVYNCAFGCENGKCRKAEKGVTTTAAATVAIPLTLPAEQVAELLSNTAQEAVYCTAVKELKKVINEHPGTMDKYGVPLESKAAYEIGKIYDELGYPNLAVEYYLKSLQAGKGDFAIEAAARVVELSGEKGATYRKRTIDDNGREITVQLKSVLGISDKDKPSAKIDVEGDGVKTLKLGEKIFSKDLTEKEDNKEYSYNWRIKKITTNDVYIEKFVTKGDKKSIGGTLSYFANRETLGLKEHEQVEGKDLYVREINLKRNVLLRVIPGTGEALRSRSNFTIHVPIEKRAISWTPDEIDKKINRTEGTIETLDKIIGKFDSVLRVWKKTCLITFAYLTIKNSLFSGSSRTLARRVAMRGMDGKSGWSAYCASNSGKGMQYKSYEVCLAENANKIGKTIDDTQRAVKQVNSEMKNYQDQEWFSEISKDYKNIEKYGDVAEGELYTPQDLRDYRFWQLMKESQSYEKYGPEEGYNFRKDVDSHLEQFNFDGKSDAYNAAVDSIEKNYKDFQTLPKEEKKQIFLDLYELGKEEDSSRLLSTQFVFREEMNITNLQVIRPAKTGFRAYTLNGEVNLDLATVRDYRDELQTLSDEASVKGDKKAVDSYNKEVDRIDTIYKTNPLAPLMSMQGQVYKTKSGEFFVGPKGYSTEEISREYAPGTTVEYYGNGKPYCIPICEGNYVKVLEFFADGSAKTVQEWNVGGDGIMCNNDDVLIKHHSSLELPQYEADQNKLVSKATRAGNKKSGDVYSACGRDFIVSTRQAMQLQQVNNPGCYDVMDPNDCQTLFGVCDPVMCPVSRFNLGGAWPVENVVQSGLIGSLVLGLHNFNMPKEPIPVCLTGIKAGLENIRSILQGYVECLKTAKVHGKSVGICDKIRSIFICETIWKEALALLKVKGGVFNWIGQHFFGESQGGGEYLTFQSSMENIGDSVRFFTKEYATTSFAAFNSRSTDEIGATICKAAIYGKLPDVGEMFEQLSTPESPPQYTAVLTIIPYSETQQKSRYQAYYHVYAGENDDVDYSVYLKDAKGNVFYVTEQCNGRYGSIEKGGLADFSIDCVADMGYNEICINVNGWTECGFGKVSSSFAIDYLNDLIVEDEVKREITSESDCVPTYSRTSPTLGSMTLPGEHDLVSTGVQRVCSINNPGQGTNANNWKIVGSCGMDNQGRSLGNCWISLDSVNINNLDTRADVVDELDESTLEHVKKQLGYTDLLNSEESRVELQRIHDLDKDTCTQVITSYRAYNNLVTISLSPAVAAEAQYNTGMMLVMLARKEGCTLVDPLRDLNRLIVQLKNEISALILDYTAEIVKIEAQYSRGTGMDEALGEKMEEYLEKVDVLEDKYVNKAKAVMASKNLPLSALRSFEDYIDVDLKDARDAITGGYEEYSEKEVTPGMVQHYELLCGQCGDGVFDVCDREECYALSSGRCFFVEKTFPKPNECKPCILGAAEGCKAITDEARCQNDNPCVRAAGLNCEWDALGGGRCVTATDLTSKDIQSKENICKQCEDWITCGKDECHSISNDCYFDEVSGGVTRFFVDDAQCHTCSWATSCADLDNDKEQCEDSSCTQQFKMYCRWDDSERRCEESSEPMHKVEARKEVTYTTDCFIEDGFGENFGCMAYDENVDYKLDTVLGNYLKTKSKLSADDIGKVITAIKKYSKQYNVNPYVIVGAIEMETSSWNKDAYNPADPSYGLMQCKDKEEAKGNIDIAIDCGTKKLGNTIHGLARCPDVTVNTFVELRVAYTAGPGTGCKNILDTREANGDVDKLDFKKETKDRWKRRWPQAISLIRRLWTEANIPESFEEEEPEFTGSVDVTPSGNKPSERMFSVCTKDEVSGASEGLARLKAILDVWVEESMDNGAIYVHGGKTGKSTLKCTNHGSKSWMRERLLRYFPSDPLPEDLSLDELRDIYQDKVVDSFSNHYLCGDCITYQVQLFDCAFGKKVYTSMANPPEAPLIAEWDGKEGNCWDSITSQIDLRFGDIIKLQPNHCILYTGGESEYKGESYEIMDMGSFGFPRSAGITKARVTPRFNGNRPAGVRLIKDAEIALKSSRIKSCKVRRINMGEEVEKETVEEEGTCGEECPGEEESIQGVEYFELERNNKKYRVMKIDLEKNDLSVATANSISGQSRMLVEDACELIPGCVGITNGGFPASEGGILIEGGQKVTGYDFRDYKIDPKDRRGKLDAVFFVKDDIPAIRHINLFKDYYESLPQSIESALQLGPLLIDDGEINYEQIEDENYKFYSVLNKRGVIGIECDGPYFVALSHIDEHSEDVKCQRTDNMYTEMAQILKDDLGCKYAMSLDGGGSVSMAVPSEGIVAHDCLTSRDDYQPRAVINFIVATAKANSMEEQEEKGLLERAWDALSSANPYATG